MSVDVPFGSRCMGACHLLSLCLYLKFIKLIIENIFSSCFHVVNVLGTVIWIFPSLDFNHLQFSFFCEMSSIAYRKARAQIL